ncbi:3-deoxy-D-manno-octulosonic acid transferase [Desulfovibrio aminophilus]|nr:glycosyltransferase N-terminal domain-containing protein [Desulfovibrio aminophilus]MCM0753753.1 3-deoxy-D-manno-octulosonic acid transferase [Desulfovibrio aminophilus]
MSRTLLESVYDLAWKLAVPFLSSNARLREGLEERTLRSGPPPRARVWIQAASGGEAYLAWDVLRCLTPPGEGGLDVLCTTNTRQGLGILRQAAVDPELPEGLRVQARYFPFDAPSLMERAVSAVGPEVAVLLESEMWPGFLAACRRHGTRVLLANGRMTDTSLARYRAVPGAARLLRPDLVLAMSPEDRARFAALFGPERVRLMPNIKFGRMARASAPAGDNPLRGLLPGDAPFVVLGSVRRQEEAEVLELARGLLEAWPGAVLGLFPRHMNRVAAWERLLRRAGLPFARRSALRGAAAPGVILLWDAFGELGHAYGLARAAFVGGSLKPLGGQNFLEPLGAGVVPVIGPHWSNFAWAGRELLDQGLVREAADARDAARILAELLERTPDREAVRRAAREHAAGKSGGAREVCARIAQWLQNE